MSFPEFVVQEGVKRSWQFYKDNSYVLGYLLKELPIERQEEYKTTLENDNLNVHFGFPKNQSLLPSAAIVLRGEFEDKEGQFIGDDQDSNRSVPYPAVDNDAPFRGDDTFRFRETEDYHGVTYSLDSKEGRTIGLNPKTGKGEIRHSSPRSKNMFEQREVGRFSDDKFEKMGITQRIWDDSLRKITSSGVGYRSVIDIVITTDNLEKTLVYYKLLRIILSAWKTWFEVNGVINPIFSGSDLRPNEQLIDNTVAYQRTLTLRYLNIDKMFEVQKVLAAFMIQIDMATPNGSGGYDLERLIDFPEDDD
jgi:hypothetical protein